MIQSFSNIIIYWACVALAGCLIGIATMFNRLAGHTTQWAKDLLEFAQRRVQ